MTPGLGFILLVLATLVVCYSLLIEPLMCQRVHVNVPVPQLPSGLRILFLTDMHHHRWGKREESFLRCLPTDGIDVILFGGDFLGSQLGIESSLKFIHEVCVRFPKTPMYGVCGNAEHKLHPKVRGEFITRLQKSGVVILDNTNTELVIGGQRISIIGTDDPYYGFHDLSAAFSGVDETLPKILLTHSPQVIRSALAYSPHLVVCGHTHGGQVRLPGLGPIRTQNPLSRMIAMGLFSPERLEATLNISGRVTTWLYISRGLGLAFVPHMRWLAPRFMCRPEITVITISK